MTTGELFYPYFEQKVSFAALRGKRKNANITSELTAWEALVETVERHGAVRESASGEYLIDHDVLVGALPHDPISRQSIFQAVAAANAIPGAQAASRGSARSTVTAPGAAPVVAPSPSSIIDIIKTILGAAADLTTIEVNVKALAAGTTIVRRTWWEIELAFTKPAAEALGALLGTNLTALTALLTALAAIPQLAILGAISAVAAVLFKGLSELISKADEGDNGVLVTLYAWIIPFIRAAATPAESV